MRSSSLHLAAGLGVTALVAGLTLAGPASAAPRAAYATKTSVASVTAIAGKKATLAATISPKPRGGTLTFSTGGRAIAGCSRLAIRSGRSACAPTFTAGRHTVTAAYSGSSSGYRASSGVRTITVAKAITQPAPAPTPAPTAKTFVGGVGSCTTSVGALVAVDFQNWSGPVVRGCDPNPTTGINLLATAGFTTTGTTHDGPYFVCRIANPLFAKGAPYPTPTQDPCVNTPPASAYWSFWLAPKGSDTWTYSKLGAYSDQTQAGEVEAWTFGATDIAGAKGQPTFTPNQVRSGLPAATADGRRAAIAVAVASTPDLAKGADYLVTSLTDGEYYDPFGVGFGDFGLTMDGALALAAAGNQDAALAKVVAFLDDRGKDASGRTVDDYTGIGTQYAGGGYVGKEALVAEATGYDQRDFGGHDLIKALDGLVCAKAITNVCAGAGNFQYSPSTFDQALGIVAQLRAGDTSGAAKPVAYLEGLQHSSGAFPSVLPGNDSETDSTAMAAMALALVPGSTARTALGKALGWLGGQQEASGGFPGASGDSVNSAAIVVQALRLDAQTYASQITKTESFLASEQNTDGGFNVAGGAEANGSDLRASTQALGGAVGTPFGSVLDDLRAKSTATDGATYLVSQLTGGDHYTSSFNGSSFDDQGLTADGLFALLGAGGHAGTVAAMVKYLTGQVDAYADPTGAAGGPYSGSLAKLALVAESTGGDPHAFGGTDLLGLLTSKVCTAAIAGDFSPCTAKGDFDNAFSTVSQALGVLALQASPIASDHLTIDSSEVVRLHQLQCADGGFSSTLIAPGATCTSEVDTTGYAVQALATVQGTDTWLGAAQVYLEKAQAASGRYIGAAGENTNSTALAAQALQSLVGALTAATADPPQPKTITPIRTWQSALTGLTGLSVAGGGFGITSNVTADLRASTQGVAAAAQVSLLQLSGAAVLSLPRVADATAPGGGTSTTPGSGTSSSPAAGSSGSLTHGANGSGSTVTGGTANTGVTARDQLLWALLLLLLGATIAYAGRRRVAVVLGRHRVVAGGRHR